MSRPTGTCRLCRTEALLCDSHIVPAWCYENAKHDAEEGRVRQLVRMKDGTAIFSNEEVTDYLLCEGCEGRFSREFENYISRLCVQRDGTFPWLAIGNGGSAGDQDKIARFACSVVWRASVSRKCRTQLGAKYEPMFADYLLGKRALPDEVVVILFLTEATPFHRLISVPVPNNVGGHHHHWFFVNGAKFIVLVGNAIPPAYRKLCIARTGIVAISNGDDLLRNFGEDIRDSVPKGKLARMG